MNGPPNDLVIGDFEVVLLFQSSVAWERAAGLSTPVDDGVGGAIGNEPKFEMRSKGLKTALRPHFKQHAVAVTCDCQNRRADRLQKCCQAPCAVEIEPGS